MKNNRGNRRQTLRQFVKFTPMATLLVLAVAGPHAAFSAEPQALVIARDMDVNSLDPSRAFCDTCQIYLTATYETLIRIAADNRTLTPGLATAWESNADQTQYTFRLNPEAKFADGSPVEAKDVKWSWERLQNIKGPASYFMAGVEKIDTPDTYTVVVHFESPNSEFLGIVNAPYTAVINSDVAMQEGATAAADADASDKAENWFLYHSAGSGPYVLASYKPNDELRLRRNDKYWGAPPQIGDVVIKQTKDAVSQAQMLESGAADIAMQIDPDTARSIRSKDVIVRMVPSFNFIYVALSPGAKDNKLPLTREIREAFGHALDYRGVIELTVGGNGHLQAAPIPNGFPGTKKLPLPEQDLAKAKKLLQQAGVGDGFELEARFPNVNVYGVDFSTMMQKVQQDLAKVDIKVNLQPLTFPVWVDQIYGDGIPLTAVYFAPDYFGSAQYVRYFGMIPEAAWGKRSGAKTNDKEVEPTTTSAWR
jgi:peptide/nickel transport system substrate-binding protein